MGEESIRNLLQQIGEVLASEGRTGSTSGGVNENISHCVYLFGFGFC
jgi:hypothetical protein